jgi:hypothetical protein
MVSIGIACQIGAEGLEEYVADAVLILPKSAAVTASIPMLPRGQDNVGRSYTFVEQKCTENEVLAPACIITA